MLKLAAMCPPYSANRPNPKRL